MYKKSVIFQVGTYKGIVVAIKKVKKDKIILDRDDLLELKFVSLCIQVEIFILLCITS